MVRPSCAPFVYKGMILKVSVGTGCASCDPHAGRPFLLILPLKSLDSHDMRELYNLQEPRLQGGGRVSEKVDMVRS